MWWRLGLAVQQRFLGIRLRVRLGRPKKRTQKRAATEGPHGDDQEGLASSRKTRRTRKDEESPGSKSRHELPRREDPDVPDEVSPRMARRNAKRKADAESNRVPSDASEKPSTRRSARTAKKPRQEF